MPDRLFILRKPRYLENLEKTGKLGNIKLDPTVFEHELSAFRHVENYSDTSVYNNKEASK